MYSRLVLPLMAISCFAGGLAHAADTVSAAETNFYRAVSRGDAETAYDQMHPALKDLIDLPVFEAWSIAVRDNLGSCVSKTRTSFKQTQQLTGVKIDIESQLVFENGTAKASMEFLDGQLIALHVQSDQLLNWFQGPSRLDPYTNKAEAFISAFLNQDSEQARLLMHDALKEMVADNKLESMIETIVDNGGALQSLQLNTHRISLQKDRQVLILVYGIECEKATGECEIEIQFVGMKGHLISFNFR